MNDALSTLLHTILAVMCGMAVTEGASDENKSHTRGVFSMLIGLLGLAYCVAKILDLIIQF